MAANRGKGSWPLAYEDGHAKAGKHTTSWLTPPALVRALGEFNLDPCEAIGQPWHLARHWYTEAEDGLKQPWHGRVWCNPPYGRLTLPFVKRMAKHGNGVILVFSKTETEWFEVIWKHASALLFLRNRIHFYGLDGEMSAGHTGPSVLCAFGLRNSKSLWDSGMAGAFVAAPTWHPGADAKEVSAWK
jgi:hypothetical protein